MAKELAAFAPLDPEGINHRLTSMWFTKDRHITCMSICIELQAVAIELAYLPMSKETRLGIGARLLAVTAEMRTLLCDRPVDVPATKLRLAAHGVTDDVLIYAVTH